MRIGFNPNKDKAIESDDFFHQVIIPVYIPNYEGYFKDSFTILKYCLESLFRTAHSKTYITVVNNGSCTEIVDYLNKLYFEKKIHEIIHTTNIGYINAMIKGVAGQKFDLITTCDSDVLFLNGWQEATYKIFKTFPKAGAVCPTPSSRSYKNYTSNIWFEMLFSKRMRFTNVKNKNALKKFAESIDNPDFYNNHHLEKYLTVTKDDVRAVVGAGHFVVTYKSHIFDRIDKSCNYILGGGSDDIFDLPVIKKGLWRLSTEDNYTYHLGNIFEDWMTSELDAVVDDNSVLDPIFFKNTHTSILSYWIKSVFFKKIFFKKTILKFCLKQKQLSREAIENY